MAGIGIALTNKTVEVLESPTGLSSAIANLAEAGLVLAPLAQSQLVTQNIAIELAERNLEARYPAVHVYCEKLVNVMKEKFRSFSGTAQMIIEVRVSQDRLDELGKVLQLYVDAVTQVLDGSRGDWGGGMYYTGGYEAVFGAVKRGGRNLIQSAKVGFEVQVSRG
ncbi:MAG: hypothetical protein WD696_16525 [Bryobacteraceae bacterium]